MNQQVDTFLLEGCGRCSLYRTPDCKVHNWTEELRELRRIALHCGLTEEYKWSQPCYTLDKKNVLIVSALRDHAMISFFKGVLLKDDYEILSTPGPNSQSARLIKFVNVAQVLEQESVIVEYIQEAIELEKAGADVKFKKSPEPIPKELQELFTKNPDLQSAFYNLTPDDKEVISSIFPNQNNLKQEFPELKNVYLKS